MSSAGGIEEDLIKCLAPTYLGDFTLLGRDLRLKGINRIGNLLAPNDNYCKFEDWILPILDAMLEEQNSQVCEMHTCVCVCVVVCTVCVCVLVCMRAFVCTRVRTIRVYGEACFGFKMCSSGYNCTVSSTDQSMCACTCLQGVNWTPSKMIARLGKEIDHPDSVYYWAYKVSDYMFVCMCVRQCSRQKFEIGGAKNF